MERSSSIFQELPVPPKSLKGFTSDLKVVWRQWDIQTMLVSSFTIQLILIVIGPFRKNSSSRVITVCVWLAYLLADWVAAQAIGLVSKAAIDITTMDVSELDQVGLYAFWAQFLLLHLGGPDTITALALQDSELWLRTGLHLSVQVYSTGGVVFRAISQSQGSLWLPTILMFVAGVIKYMERLFSLFYGRLYKFSYQGSFSDPRDSPQYPDELRDEVRKKLKAKDHDDHDGDLGVVSSKTDVVMVRDAFSFFQCTKGLYAGQKLSQAQPEDDQLYYSQRTAEEAFRVLEIQLNLAYEAFYTKAVIVCTSLWWRTLRHFVTFLQVWCLIIWVLFTDKSAFPRSNIRVTNAILLGAVVVDVYAFLKIQLWSDWTIAQLGKESPLNRVCNALLSLRRRTWGAVWRKEQAWTWQRLRRALFRRWSESIPQFNLIAMYCVNEHSNNLLIRAIKYIELGEEELERATRYVTHKWFTNHLRDFIFEDLMHKMTTKGAFENVGNVKGGWACLDLQRSTGNEDILPKVSKLLDTRGEYDLILMYWHVITELMYTETVTPEEQKNKEETKSRDICKTLSDYMMYLLIHQRDMMPINDSYVTDGRLFWMTRYLQTIRFRAMLEGETGTQEPKESTPAGNRKDIRRQKIRQHALCSFYMGDPRTEQEKTYIHPLIEELNDLKEKQIGKWKFMAKVWGELLYYAAIRSAPKLHAARLKEGGELLSFVWLLLVQLGFGIQGSNKHENEHAKAQLYAYNIDGVGMPDWESKPKPNVLKREQVGAPATSLDATHEIP